MLGFGKEDDVEVPIAVMLANLSDRRDFSDEWLLNASSTARVVSPVEKATR